jgi:hypothetical protein
VSKRNSEQQFRVVADKSANTTTLVLNQDVAVDIEARSVNSSFVNPKVSLNISSGTVVEVIRRTSVSYVVRAELTNGLSFEVEIPSNAVN